MTRIRIFKEEDKIEELGNKICKFVEYHEGDRGQNILALAALAEILFNIREIFKSYDERFEKLEECLKEKERMIVNK